MFAGSGNRSDVAPAVPILHASVLVMTAPRTPLLLCSILAATAAGFVAWTWPLAAHFSTHVPIQAAPLYGAGPGQPPSGWDLILNNDQTLSIWGAAGNARALARGDLRALVDQGQCAPMPAEFALGEHMIELGVLALPWWIVSGDPVVAYNGALATALVVAALGMTLFLRGVGVHPVAAALGALAYAFATPRLVDLPYHPAVIGTHWLPWVLWSFDRVLDARSWSAVAMFAATSVLAALVGSYPLLAAALVGVAYGLARVVQSLGGDGARALPWPQLAVSITPVVAASIALVLTYAAVQATWGAVGSSGGKYLATPRDFLPGGEFSIGPVALAGLVPLAFALGDRALRRRATPLVVAALATGLFCCRFGPTDSGASLFEWLAARIAVLGSVRAPGKAALGVVLVLQALGALGWSRAFARWPRAVVAGVATLLVVATAVEVEAPARFRSVVGRGASTTLREVAPSAASVAALRSLERDARGRTARAVIDLPEGRMVRAPRALLDALYHGLPTTACYNSLIPPTVPAVSSLVSRLRGEGGVLEASAAGFGYVIERAKSGPPRGDALAAEPLASGDDFTIWKLPAAPDTHRDPSRLAATIRSGRRVADGGLPGYPHELLVEVTNRAAETWTLAGSIEPWSGRVVIVPASGGEPFATRAIGVLPLSLAPGATATMTLSMPEGPTDGAYNVEVKPSPGSGGALRAQGVPWSTAPGAP